MQLINFYILFVKICPIREISSYMIIVKYLRILTKKIPKIALLSFTKTSIAPSEIITIFY